MKGEMEEEMEEEMRVLSELREKFRSHAHENLFLRLIRSSEHEHDSSYYFSYKLGATKISLMKKTAPQAITPRITSCGRNGPGRSRTRGMSMMRSLAAL